MAASSNPRSIWTGSITFGLVNIPVKMYTAVSEERIHFKMLHDEDKVPLKQKMYCPVENKDVHPEHIVRGYEVEKGQFVVVHEEDLEALEPKKTKAIEIEDFVDLDDIDPIYYDKAYYLAPAEGAARSYKLLCEAMERTKRVGIARFVRSNKEYLVALRPMDGVIGLATMHFGAEVRDAEDVPGAPVPGKVDEREMKVAEHLIESLSTKFDPSKYRDEYKERVQEMLRRKAEGEEIHVAPATEARPTRTTDLVSALEASVAALRKERGGGVATVKDRKAETGSPKGESRRTQTRRRKSA